MVRAVLLKYVGVVVLTICYHPPPTTIQIHLTLRTTSIIYFAVTLLKTTKTLHPNSNEAFYILQVLFF